MRSSLDPPARRQPANGGARLDSRSLRMLEALPIHLRMLHVRRDFPHVLNRIAADWDAPHRFQRLMMSLLTDDRGNRQGFPIEVMMELVDLRVYYFLEVHPELRRIYDNDGPRR
jgi:hypothetical protein